MLVRWVCKSSYWLSLELAVCSLCETVNLRNGRNVIVMVSCESCSQIFHNCKSVYTCLSICSSQIATRVIFFPVPNAEYAKECKSNAKTTQHCSTSTYKSLIDNLPILVDNGLLGLGVDFRLFGRRGAHGQGTRRSNSHCRGSRCLSLWC